MFADSTPQDGVGEWVALCLDFPSSGDEVMSLLCGNYRVEHNREVPAGGIFHTHRNVKAAYHETVLLVLHRTRSDRHVGEQVR